jgi:hypothetical protein
MAVLVQKPDDGRWYRKQSDGTEDVWCNNCVRWIPVASPVHTCYDALAVFGLKRTPQDTDDTYKDFVGG